MSLHCTPTGASVQICCGTTVLGSYSPASTDPCDQKVAELATQIMATGTITLDDSVCHDTFLRAAQSGHTLVLKILLASGRSLSEEALGVAVASAVGAGHETTVRFLLSDGRAISTWDLRNAAQCAAREGHEGIVRFLLSDGRTLSESALGEAVVSASRRGHETTVRFLLSDGRTIPDLRLLTAVALAGDNGHETTVRFLLSNGRTLSTSLLGMAVHPAAAAGHETIVRFLLSDGRTIPESALGMAVRAAAAAGHEGIVRFLLSDGRTLSEEALGEAVVSASRGGHETTVRFLLSDGRTIPEDFRHRCILVAANRGHYGVLEHLLQQGAIPATVRNSARTQASGPLAGAMRDILTVVPVIDAPAAAAAGTSRMRLTFADVRANPETYLRAVCDDGFPHGIHLEDQPHVVDLGGVTKQFITTLITALINKGILTLTGSEFPLAKDAERKEALTQLGRFCSLLDERNEGRSDKFVTGRVFTPDFYVLAQRIHAAADPEAKRRCAAELLRDDSSAGMYAQVFLPAEAAAAAASAGGSGAATLAAVLMCSEEEALEAAQEEIEAYVEAAEAFLAGMTEEFTAQLLGADPVAFAERLQGQPASKEAILAALQRDEGVPEEQFTWLRERIAASDEAWRRKFLAAVTGNETLPAGVTIRIARHSIPVFELHTCFNSIHLPGIAMGEEAFKAGLDAAITGAGYETA